jgi:hypothetical protein
MNHYAATVLGGRPPFPRFHPLLLSLSEAFNKSGTAPDISSVSEDDPRAVRSNYYTPPNDLPPLDIPFDDKNDGALQSAAHDSSLCWQHPTWRLWQPNLKKYCRR